MIQDVNLAALPLLLGPVICAVAAILILVFAVLNFMSAAKGRGYVVFKTLASLAAWFFASWAMFFLVFVVVYSGAHARDRAAGGYRAEVSLLILDALYALVGGGLALWVRHRADGGPRSIFAGDAT